MPSSYTISDLSKAFDVTTRSIRFYEDQGLLSPDRQGQNRLFSQRDFTRLKLILRGKRLGFSLNEIGEILNMYDEAEGEVSQLSHLLIKFREKREVLLAKKRDIETALEEIETLEASCKERLNTLEVSEEG